MEITPDMDDMINEVVKDLEKSEESGIASEYFEFIGRFEDIANEELKHEHVQTLAKDIETLQNAPDLPDKLKKTFPERAISEEQFQSLIHMLRSLSIREVQFIEPKKEEAIVCLLTHLK